MLVMRSTSFARTVTGCADPLLVASPIMGVVGEAALDPDQVKKIATEEQIKAEIVALGGTAY